MKRWWYQNGWRIRIKIYTLLKKPIDLLRFVLHLLQILLNLIDRFLIWLLWNVLDALFKYRKIDEECLNVNKKLILLYRRFLKF